MLKKLLLILFLIGPYFLNSMEERSRPGNFHDYLCKDIAYEVVTKMTNKEEERCKLLFRLLPVDLQTIINNLATCPAITHHYPYFALAGSDTIDNMSMLKAIVLYKLKLPYVCVSAQQLVSSHQYITAENIERLLQKIEHDPQTPVLLLDRLDELTHAHSSEETAHRVDVVCRIFEKSKNLGRLLLLATVHNINAIPLPLKVALFSKLFTIEEPTYWVRKNMVNFFMQQHDDVIFELNVLDTFLEKTQSFSLSDIEALLNKSIVMGEYRYDSNKVVVSKRTLVSVVYEATEYNMVLLGIKRVLEDVLDNNMSRKDVAAYTAKCKEAVEKFYKEFGLSKEDVVINKDIDLIERINDHDIDGSYLFNNEDIRFFLQNICNKLNAQ